MFQRNTSTGYYGALRPARAKPDDDQRMLATLIGNLRGMAYRCRNDAEWTMELVSDGCRELTGFDPADLLNNSRVSYETVTHADDRARVRREIERALDAEERFSVEYRIVRPDGAVKWVWETGIGIGGGTKPVFIEGFIQDISERKAAEKKLELAERRYRDIFENAIEGIFQSTSEGHYIAVNPALARIYGYETPDALMSSMRNIGTQLYVQAGRREEFIALVRERGRVEGFTSEVRTRGAGTIWISENARCVYDDAGAFLHFEGTVMDVTDKRRYEEQLRHQATHDSLTGLPGRALFFDRLAQATAYAERHGGLVGVAFVDLDNFKHINDGLGHDAGDLVLKTMADRMSSCLRVSDTVARLGGDEFALVLTAEPDEEVLAATLARIGAVLCEPIHTAYSVLEVTCSVGVAVYPRDGRDGPALLKSADLAMYTAKSGGRSAIRFARSDPS